MFKILNKCNALVLVCLPFYFTTIIVWLFIDGMLLLVTCIYLLFRIASLINQDRINQLQKENQTPSKL